MNFGPLRWRTPLCGVLMLFTALSLLACSNSSDSGGGFVPPADAVDAAPALESVATILDEELHVEFFDWIDNAVGHYKTLRETRSGAAGQLGQASLIRWGEPRTRLEMLGVGPYFDLGVREIMNAPLDATEFVDTLANLPEVVDETWAAALPLGQRGLEALNYLVYEHVTDLTDEGWALRHDPIVAMLSYHRDLAEMMLNAWRAPESEVRAGFEGAGDAGHPSQSELINASANRVSEALRQVHTDMRFWFDMNPDDIEVTQDFDQLYLDIGGAYESFKIAIFGAYGDRVDGGIDAILTHADPMVIATLSMSYEVGRAAMDAFLPMDRRVRDYFVEQDMRLEFEMAMDHLEELFLIMRDQVLPVLADAPLYPLG